MAKSEVKYGALISYLSIILNSLYGLVITPFILGAIGKSEYGVYQSVAAITASVAILEFGIGSTIQRYLARYLALKDERNNSNFSAMALVQTAVLSLVMAITCFCIYFALDSMYGRTFTELEMMRAKQVFIVLSVYVVLHIYENYLWGIISGYNRFIFSNSTKVILLFLKVGLYLLILPFLQNALAIVIISLTIEIIQIIVEYLYIKLKLHHRVKLYKWDNSVFKESFFYTLLLFIQSLIVQFNGNVDNMFIGAMIGATSVTVYSFAIVLFGMYENFAVSISSVILPSVTNYIVAGADARQMEKVVIKYGRVQWITLGAALFGFIIYGKEFYYLWLGEGFEDCYALALILMIPVMFPLIVNTCLAILKAQNLLTFRTIALTYAAVVNVLITYIGMHYYGYWAAAIGTATSTIISGVISLNIYYHVKLKLRMIYIYRQIFKRSLLCMLITAVVCYPLNYIMYGNWIALIIKIAAFLVIFGLFMIFYGFNQEEKQMFKIKIQI